MSAALKKKSFTYEGRQWERVDTADIYASGVCQYQDNGTVKECSVQLENISTTGICVKSSKKLYVGTKVAIRIDFPHNAKVVGEVVWVVPVKDGWKLGVEVTEELDQLDSLFTDALFI